MAAIAFVFFVLFHCLTRLTAGMWSPQAQLGVRTVSDARLSPGGSFFFYTIMEEVSLNETAIYQTRFEIQHLPPRALAAQPPQPNVAPEITAFCLEHGCSSPSWIPKQGDGAITLLSSGSLWISTLSSDSFTKPTLLQTNLFSLPLNFYAWSPSNRTIAYSVDFVSKNDPHHRRIDEDIIIDVINAVPKAAKHALCFTEFDENFRTVSDKCINEIEGKSIGFPGWLISCWPYGSQFVWSPDGKHLAFTTTNTTYANDWMSLGISLLDVSSIKDNSSLGITPVIGEDESVFQPRYSPDGRFLAFTQIDKRYMVWAQAWRICVLATTMDTPAVCDKIGTYDLEPQLIGWTADSRFIIYTEQEKLSLSVYSMELKDGQLMKYEPIHVTTKSGVIQGHGVFSGVSLEYVRGGVEFPQTGFGFTYENMHTGQEAYFGYASIASDGLTLDIEATALTETNANASSYNFPNYTLVSYKSTGGILVEAFLVLPSNMTMKKIQTTSVLVYVHPGPNMAHTATFMGFGGVGARYPIATFAELGYYVLLPNIRGSSGYGIDYRLANYKDWGGGDYDDLVQGIRTVIDQYQLPKGRAGMFGWSYGGYLTAVALTRANEIAPEIELVAVSIGGGIVDLISHTGTADISRILSGSFGGYFWESDEMRKFYEERSPIYHVKNATAYTLINHGAYDPRVPLSQAFQLHYALKSQWQSMVPERSVEFVVYPKSGHIPSDPNELIDVWDYNVYWFTKFLSNEGPSGK